MTFRVTHFDIHGRCRRLIVLASRNGRAMACAEQLFGDAIGMSAIRLSPPQEAE